MAMDTAALAAVAFVAVAFAAVGDVYDRPVYQGSAGYTDSVIGQVQPV
jgi:lipoprotein signal peptidase